MDFLFFCMFILVVKFYVREAVLAKQFALQITLIIRCPRQIGKKKAGNLHLTPYIKVGKLN